MPSTFATQFDNLYNSAFRMFLEDATLTIHAGDVAHGGTLTPTTYDIKVNASDQVQDVEDTKGVTKAQSQAYTFRFVVPADIKATDITMQRDYITYNNIKYYMQRQTKGGTEGSSQIVVYATTMKVINIGKSFR